MFNLKNNIQKLKIVFSDKKSAKKSSPADSKTSVKPTHKQEELILKNKFYQM